MDFSIILQSPQIRPLVQENALERAFHDALFPRLLFRGEATSQEWPAGVGDTQLFSAPGLLPTKAKPSIPGTDPLPQTWPSEQWPAQLQQYDGTIDTHMPTSMVAIANLFLRNAHQLGLQGAGSLNKVARNRLYNAALAGNTVADGAAVATTALRVKRLNGFTRARRPDLPAGSPVRFELVSATNPLAIVLFDNAVETANTVVGFTPDTPGDEVGPGVLTLGTATTNVLNRAYVLANDRTTIVRVGGGNKVDDVGSADTPTLSDVRTAISNMWMNNVPEHPDGRFHCHIDPVSQSKIFSDPEFRQLMTALPDYYVYRQFALGEMLNTVFYRNSVCPVASTVDGGPTATFLQDDPFAGELFNTGAPGGVRIHRMLFTAQGGMFEYYSDLSQLITEAGITGKVAEPRLVNNGIEVFSERIQLVIRAPLNRTMDMVSTTWKFIGDWAMRTDACTGDAQRFKRTVVIEHGE